jgi:hypothetical protein
VQRRLLSIVFNILKKQENLDDVHQNKSWYMCRMDYQMATKKSTLYEYVFMVMYQSLENISEKILPNRCVVHPVCVSACVLMKHLFYKE